MIIIVDHVCQITILSHDRHVYTTAMYKLVIISVDAVYTSTNINVLCTQITKTAKGNEQLMYTANENDTTRHVQWPDN